MLDFVNGVAVLRTKQKQYDEAESLFKEALKGRRQKLYEDHPATLESKNDLAVLYKEQNRYDEAEKFLLDAVNGRRLKLGDTHPHTIKSWNNLIELYEDWKKPENVNQWRAKLTQTEAVNE
jgi:tetratricopeptide (TPR) repeat protein